MNLGFVIAGFVAVVISLHLTRVATRTAVKASEDADKVLALTLENVDALKRSATATERPVASSEVATKQSLRASVSIESGFLLNVADCLEPSMDKSR